MTEQGQADVVFISSVSSTHTYPYGGIYAATKAAVDTLAETLRLESQPDVRTTVIRPGVVDTSFFESMIHGDQTPESIAWGAVQPEQIADAVYYAVTRDPGIAINEIVIRPALNRCDETTAAMRCCRNRSFTEHLSVDHCQ